MLFLLTVAISVACAVVYKYTASVLDPVLWSKPNALPSFVGPTAVNQILKYSDKGIGDFSGPESLAFDSETGDAFASFNDGSVGKFSDKGEFLGRLFFVGGFLSTEISNRTDGLQAQELLSWCGEESKSGRLAWRKEDEFKCGRPLGLRFRKVNGEKHLFILDTRHGLFQFNIETKTATHVFNAHTTITLPTDPARATVPVDPNALKPMMFFNDLDITQDNRVIFDDSSYKNTRSENRQEVLDGAPRGRLFQYDLGTGELKVLMCGLHFPNGVQLLNNRPPPTPPSDESTSRALRDVEVIVSELARFRLVKINLSYTSVQSGAYLESCGEGGSFDQAVDYSLAHPDEQTAVSVFTDSLPGIPDNIRMDPIHTDRNGRGYYLIGFGSISVRPFSLLWLAYQSVVLREIVGKFVPMPLVEKLVPKYGLVLVVNSDGEIVYSMHDQGGTVVALLSQGDIHPRTGDLWLGSHSESYVGILKKAFLPSAWE